MLEDFEEKGTRHNFKYKEEEEGGCPNFKAEFQVGQCRTVVNKLLSGCLASCLVAFIFFSKHCLLYTTSKKLFVTLVVDQMSWPQKCQKGGTELTRLHISD